jgi:hypothetical protein
MIEPNTGRIYHEYYAQPAQYLQCDETSKHLIRYEQDYDDTQRSQRLDYSEKEIPALIAYLQRWNIVPIDATGSQDVICAEAMQHIEVANKAL